MYTVTYACGCQEIQQTPNWCRRCPMHGEPARRSFVGAPEGLGYRTPAIPPEGLFYPAIQGMKDWCH